MKKITISILIIVLIFICTACNYKVLDTNWEFNYAYITLPNDSTIEVEVDKWTEDNSSITIQSIDGQIYNVSYHNCIMTKNKLEEY